MYLAVSSAQGSVDSMTALDAALATSVKSPGVPAGMSGYVTDSQRKRVMTFYPPPYGFAAGMGCPGNCSCGGTCGGMGQVDLSNLFASGTDISGWGWPEWSIVGLGAFAVGSAVSNVANAGRKVGRSIKRARRRIGS
jgi:hypothetical protein